MTFPMMMLNLLSLSYLTSTSIISTTNIQPIGQVVHQALLVFQTEPYFVSLITNFFKKDIRYIFTGDFV